MKISSHAKHKLARYSSCFSVKLVSHQSYWIVSYGLRVTHYMDLGLLISSHIDLNLLSIFQSLNVISNSNFPMLNELHVSFCQTYSWWLSYRTEGFFLDFVKSCCFQCRVASPRICYIYATFLEPSNYQMQQHSLLPPIISQHYQSTANL